jgi:hypothetical protein
MKRVRFTEELPPIKYLSGGLESANMCTLTALLHCLLGVEGGHPDRRQTGHCCRLQQQSTSVDRFQASRRMEDVTWVLVRTLDTPDIGSGASKANFGGHLA